MLFSSMIELQLQLFLIMLIGFIAKKLKFINVAAQMSMSDLLIYIILPCNILSSFLSGIEVSPDLLRNSGFALLISLVVQLTAMYGSKLLFRRWPKEKSAVASYGMIVSNSSFIGIPVAEALYGHLGVLYTAIFQIPIRFSMWSAGLALFTNVGRKETIKKVATHPCILACVVGFALMALDVKLSGFLGDTITSLSRCTGPLAMLVIGAILADADPKQLFDGKILAFCFFRLIAFPLVVYGLLYLMKIDPMVTGIAVVLTAMPAGSSTAILAQKYGCDAEYGADLIFTSTLLSIITIPLFGLLL
ncbi:MAG: AEC family transporter [Clostridia bacterium]|nr:AEC family transporter [Clostridia bacterium]